jgi:hypothetical protein
MKPILVALSLVACAVPMTPAAAAEITYQTSGVLSGRTFDSITLNRTNYTVRYNFTDGTIFTQTVGQDMFEEILATVSGRRGRSTDTPQ